MIPLFAAAALASAPMQLSEADRAKAFTAAGFTLKRRQWQACGDPGTASYQPGAIAEVRDLDKDGLPEAVITEGSSYCFGATETGFTLVSKQPGGTWKVILRSPGVATFLAAPAARWPDLEIGGPGFCFPVYRWNGKAYRHHRYAYEGKPCRP